MTYGLGGIGDLKGGINFHPKHLGGPSKFNWYSVLGGGGQLKLTLIIGLV